MVRSLSGVAARVERLASRIRRHPSADGCSECRGAEQTTRIVCVYGDEQPDVPPESRCETCGRVIPNRYLAIRYDPSMKPPEEPSSWESLELFENR